MYWPNLKSVAFPVPEIIGVPENIGQSLDMPTLPFLQNFSWAIIRMDTVIVLAKFEVRSLTGATENAGVEKSARSNMQWWKMREWKYLYDLDTILQGWKMRELTSVQWQ